MKFATPTLGITLLAGTVLAKPTPTRTQPLEKRETTYCGQWDSVETGGYIVYNNLWGQDNADSGSQCTTVKSASGGSVSWSAEWSWSGGQYHVKSYPNAVLQANAARVSTISEMPTKWEWSYSGSNLVANVAYDIFTNNDCGSTPLYEIMVWVGALGGAGPISSTGSTIASVNINGVTWDLYKGSHSQMTVFSFVAQSKNERSFSGDLKDFFDYLVDKQGYPSSQCLYSIGAGTEPFTGSNAVFDTSSYSVSLLTGSGGGSGGSTTTSSGTTPTNGPSCASMYGQCGGQGWNGPTCCSSGTCTKANDWYSQCI